MSTVLIHESRRLVFPLDTVVDAVIELEREHQRWPAQAKLARVKLSRSSGLTLTLAASSKLPEEERRYPLATLAAAVIHYCARMHVPMPRNATKSVKIVGEGFELALDTKLFLQRQHAEPPPDASFNTVNVPQLPDVSPLAEAAADGVEAADLTAATPEAGVSEPAAPDVAPEAGDEQAA
jgi:hypothetical protein